MHAPHAHLTRLCVHAVEMAGFAGHVADWPRLGATPPAGPPPRGGTTYAPRDATYAGRGDGSRSTARRMRCATVGHVHLFDCSSAAEPMRAATWGLLSMRMASNR